VTFKFDRARLRDALRTAEASAGQEPKRPVVFRATERVNVDPAALRKDARHAPPASGATTNRAVFPPS